MHEAARHRSGVRSAQLIVGRAARRHGDASLLSRQWHLQDLEACAKSLSTRIATALTHCTQTITLVCRLITKSMASLHLLPP